MTEFEQLLLRAHQAQLEILLTMQTSADAAYCSRNAKEVSKDIEDALNDAADAADDEHDETHG